MVSFKKNYMAALAVVMVVSLSLTMAACQSVRDAYDMAKTPIEDMWVTLKIAEGVHIQAEYIVQQPQVPDNVVFVIADSSRLLTTTVVLAQTAADTYTQADNQIRAFEAIGLEVPEVVMNKALISAKAVKDRLPELTQGIERLKQDIASIKKGN